MTCKNCGFPLEIGDNFCKNCGEKVILPDSINHLKNSANTIAKMSKKKKTTMTIILVVIGMACAIVGAIFFALNISKYQGAKSSLDEINSAISAYAGSTILYEMAKQYYATQIANLQTTITHYSNILIGSGIAIAFGAICTIFSVLYMLTTRSEEDLLNNVSIKHSDNNIKYIEGETPNGTYYVPPTLMENISNDATDCESVEEIEKDDSETVEATYKDE